MPTWLLIVLLVSCVLLAVLSRRRRVARRAGQCRRHDYELRGSKHHATYPSGTKDSEGVLPIRRHTRALWACRRCPHRYVEDLEGEWSFEELCRHRQKQKGYASPWEGYETK
jgi:hypothetical protein